MGKKTHVHVVGIGLDGAAGLVDSVRQLVVQAALLVGSDRHLSYFPDCTAERLVLKDFSQAIEEIRQRIATGSGYIVVLVTGDPLFFGLGRLLLLELPNEHLTFHPHLCAVQLAFNRIKVPWQDVCTISAHGRSLDELIQALQQGVQKIAVLTDEHNTPSAIATLLLSLDLSCRYQFWVCENLGGEGERVQSWSIDALLEQTFAPLNLVILLSKSNPQAPEQLDLSALPQLGLSDEMFLSFSDRPGLMTKREIRVLVLSELALQAGQTIWDIGAGTGSVAIEIARLCPTSRIYAIEKTTAGTALIEQNCYRFQIRNVISIHGSAPESLEYLPAPDRIFIGGSGGNLSQILETCSKLAPRGVVVLALATLEHLSLALGWFKAHDEWSYQLLQVQLSRSVPVGQLTKQRAYSKEGTSVPCSLTRFAPLNPVTILTATHLG